MSHTERELDTLARTLWGEARGEGAAGQIAVAWCIRNRVEMDLHSDGKPDWWGEGYVGVCRAPWQFSCWNKSDPNFAYLVGQKLIPAGQFLTARESALAVIDGHEPDPTGGATHYYSTSMKVAPRWAAKAKLTRKIGRHLFFKDVP